MVWGGVCRSSRRRRGHGVGRDQGQELFIPTWFLPRLVLDQKSSFYAPRAGSADGAPAIEAGGFGSRLRVTGNGCTLTVSPCFPPRAKIHSSDPARDEPEPPKGPRSDGGRP